MGESAREGGGEQGSAGGATTQREGYTVYQGKEAWAEELFAACRRLGLPPDRAGRPNLRALSKKRLGLGYSTLITRIGSPGDPELETLRLLEQRAGLSVARSLLALGELTRAGLEAELGVAPGSASDVPPAVRRLMEAWAALPPDQERAIRTALRTVLGPDFGDNSPGPTPTAANRP